MTTTLPVEVVVHPLVLLSTVDHYTRVAKDTKKRVVGVLLGDTSKGTIDVKNSFAVPFDEDNNDPNVWFVDHNFLEQMNSMFRKVNAREKIVGWYSTGPKIKSTDIKINELFKDYISNPIFVIINVKPDCEGLPIDAYVAVEEIKEDGSATQFVFAHVPSSIGALEAEEIGVEHLLRDIRDTTTSTLSQEVNSKVSSLRGLESHLQDISLYLKKVCNKELPVNHRITYLMQDIFNLLPDFSHQSIVKSFAVQANDMMLVVYLSSLIRATIALHDLVNNKLTNRETEKKLVQSKKAVSKNKDKTKQDSDETKTGATKKESTP